MRYLIIDTEEMGSGGDFRETGTPIITISTNCIFSEEETMIKFREIYSAGKIFSRDNEDRMWDSLKKTL